MPLTAVPVPAPDRVVVRFTGETDLSTAPSFSAELARAAARGTRSVIVDVSSLRFWDCSGLHALVDLTAELAQAGRHVRIVGAPAATRRLIAMADFTAALDVDGPVQLPRQQPGPPPTAPASGRWRSRPERLRPARPGGPCPRRTA